MVVGMVEVVEVDDVVVGMVGLGFEAGYVVVDSAAVLVLVVAVLEALVWVALVLAADSWEVVVDHHLFLVAFVCHRHPADLRVPGCFPDFLALLHRVPDLQGPRGVPLTVRFDYFVPACGYPLQLGQSSKLQPQLNL